MTNLSVLDFFEHGGMRYVQDVANVSQNVRDMQRALLDLALLTEAPPELGKVESHSKRSRSKRPISCSRSGKTSKKPTWFLSLALQKVDLDEALNGRCVQLFSPGAR